MSEAESPEVLVIRKPLWRRTSGIWIGGAGLAIQLGLIGMLWSIGVWFWDYRAALFCVFPLMMLFLIGASIHSLILNERLFLSSWGLEVLSQDLRVKVRWADVERFRIERLPDRMHPLVGWNYDEEAIRENVSWWKAMRMGAVMHRTMDEDIGSGWEMSPEILCDTLERWRVRYS